MIPPAIHAEIVARLKKLEMVENCVILHAVESGSRAWGFPSRDSDYDVRFIYIRPREWYLSIDLETRRDVIERPLEDELDISGWDIRKALRLFAKSNPPLLEWLGSPIVYLQSHDFADRLRMQLSAFYSSVSSTYHYRHMAEGNFREYLKGEVVWLKKYLYTLRPLLAVRWLEQKRGVVPMEFVRLLETIADQPDLIADIRALVARKMAGDELDRGPWIPSISNFVTGEIERLRAFEPTRDGDAPSFEPLHQLFRQMLGAACSPSMADRT